MKFSDSWKLLLGASLLAMSTPVSAQRLLVEHLRCEYRINPVGMDVARPRLSWTLASEQREQKQTAYHVLVASSAAALARGVGDLWDPGRVDSDQTVHIAYDGKPLESRMRAWWKVRVWDKDGHPSPWSEPASWTMGLLDKSDWQAEWIADPTSVSNVPRLKPHNGYHSQLTNRAEAAKWVTINLGSPRKFDSVQLFPARPYDTPDTPGFLFPLRFKIEAASRADCSDARVLLDRTLRDEPNPGTTARVYEFASTSAQFVRLIVTRLRARKDEKYGFALAEMQVLAKGENIAEDAKVTARDSIENESWSKANLTDGVLGPVNPIADAKPLPATMFRNAFRIRGPIRRATAYVTALGLYEVRLNGQRVGSQLLAPEWTSYRKRIQYQTYDVTNLVRPGENAIGALVGEGWYAGRLIVVGPFAYGDHPRLLLQLEVELADGTRQTVVTDGTWRSSLDGPILASGIYDGEIYDARKEMPGWDSPSFDDSGWSQVRAFPRGDARLVWQRNEPIRVVKEVKPLSISEPKTGVYIVDFGQNMVGWCRLRLRGPAGATVTMRHGEVLNADGTLYTANLRSAQQVDRYTLRGEGAEVFEPHFTYHGFRYVELTGLPQPPTSQTIVGRVFHSTSPHVGTFECSSPLLNQLMRNIAWTQRGNLMSTPNDCPQRDERFGWGGDIQAFSQTAIFNMDMAAFFSKWLQDVRDDQADDGRFPDFAPHPGNPNEAFSGVPAWGDAGTIVPWRMFENYADRRLLNDHFEAARRWVDYVHRLNPSLIWINGRGNNYNDWLNGDTLIHDHWPRKGGAVPPEVFATAFFAHSTEIVAKMAHVLGRHDEAARYSGLFKDIRDAFCRQFVQADGRIHGGTQAGYALALNFNLAPEDLRPLAAKRMVEGLSRYDGHLSTGIQTTHRLMLELTRNGYHADACRLAQLRDFPSWGMMIDNGATTIWERWDGYVKGRGFQSPSMNSFNHWAFGAVGEWVWRHLVGFHPDPQQPGYKHFTIHPRPGKGVTWVRGRYQSVRGPIGCRWKIDEGKFVLDIKVPANTTASVYVPTGDVRRVTESGRPCQDAPGVRVSPPQAGTPIFHVASGRYHFEAPAVGCDAN